MEETTKKSGRGGARKGAGRKPTNHGKFTGFYPTREIEAVLAGLEGGKSAFINAAIEAHAKKLGLL